MSLTRFFLLFTLALPALHGAPAGAPPLTRARDVLNLSPAEAARHLPVRVTGVVTFCHFPARGPWSLFVQDETGGVFVSGPGPHVAPGDRVTVTGISAPGEFAPKIHRTAIEVLGTAPLPPAARKPFEDLISGREDCQWIEIAGIVRSAQRREPDGDEAVLDLAAGGGRIAVHVLLHGDRDFARLVDAEVIVRGVSATRLNRRNQLLAVEIYSPGLHEVAVARPAPAAPFDLRRSPIGNLLQFSRGGEYGHRVKVTGWVTHRSADGTLYLRDDTGALLVQTRERQPVAVGDELDVLGFPAAGPLSPLLQDAVYRRTGRHETPAPKHASATDLLDGRFDAELVSVEGRVLDSARTLRQEVLTLQSGDVVYTATLRGADASPPLVLAGSLVRLTGICAASAPTERSAPKSFHLQLRSPADVTVLAKPSWWTLARVLRVLGAGAVVTLLAFAWVVVVSRNNRLLREHREIQQELLDISGREQCRIAQDLHDGVCQQLGAVAFLTKMLEEDLNAASPAHAGAAREISKHLTDAITQTRTVAKGLFPVKLEENGLESALEELAAHTTQLFKIQCRFRGEQTVPLRDNEAARHLYYIAYEAVNNALKHAKARRVDITLHGDGRNLVLSVTNDGAAFELAPERSRGLGLHIMKYRAQAIGAAFAIGDNNGCGCTVTCTLPVSTPSSGAVLVST